MLNYTLEYERHVFKDVNKLYNKLLYKYINLLYNMASIKVNNSSISFTKVDVNGNSTTRNQETGYPTVGTILMWGGKDKTLLNNTKYLYCYGQSIKVEDYPDLHDVIGYRYGGGGTNFNLPSFKDRFPAGSKNTSNFELGVETGFQGGDHYMVDAHFPHNHSVDSLTTPVGTTFDISLWSGGRKRSTGESTSTFNGTSTNPLRWGSGGFNDVVENTLHATLPPYTIVGFIIKALP